MTTTQVKRVKAERFKTTIEDLETTGWTLKNENDRMAVMTKEGGWGSLGWHVIVFLLTVWWTIGIGNIVYALFDHYAGGTELQVKIEE